MPNQTTQIDGSTQEVLGRALISNALGERILAPAPSSFRPYRDIKTPEQMRCFCSHVRDSERNVRRGVYDRQLYAWLHSDEFDGEGCE